MILSLASTSYASANPARNQAPEKQHEEAEKQNLSRSLTRPQRLLYWTLVFLIIALVAGVSGFTGAPYV
jgi:hypothetical protein